MSHWHQQQAGPGPPPPENAAATSAETARADTRQDAIAPRAGEANFAPVHEVVLPFGSRPFSREEELQMGMELTEDTTPRDVRSRPGPGGKKLTYMPGWKSVDVANRIFGFNGWSSQVMSLRINSCRETTAKRWNVCVSCTVRVTLKDGSFHEDRGNGSAENYKSEGEALMLAEKEAVTDARKRALKNFGNRLGLSLYNDEHLRYLQSAASRPKSSSAAARNAAAKQAQPAGPQRAAPQRPALQPIQQANGQSGIVPPRPPASAASSGVPPQQAPQASKEVAVTAQVKMQADDAAQRRARLGKVAELKQRQADKLRLEATAGITPNPAAQAPQQSYQHPPLPQQQAQQHPPLPPQHPHQYPPLPPRQSHQQPPLPHQPAHQQTLPPARSDNLPPPPHPAQPPQAPAAQQHRQTEVRQEPPQQPPQQAAPTPDAAPIAAPPALAEEERRRREARILKAKLMQEQALARRKSLQQAQKPPSPTIRMMLASNQQQQRPPAPATTPGKPAIASSPVTPAGSSVCSGISRHEPHFTTTPVRQPGIARHPPAVPAPSAPGYAGEKRPAVAQGYGAAAQPPAKRPAHGAHAPAQRFAAASTLPAGYAAQARSRDCEAEDANALLAAFASDME